MVRVNAASRAIAVPKELVSSGVVELEPVPGGRFEGELPDHVGKYLQSIARNPMEYMVTAMEEPEKEPAKPEPAPEPAKPEPEQKAAPSHHTGGKR